MTIGLFARSRNLGAALLGIVAASSSWGCHRSDSRHGTPVADTARNIEITEQEIEIGCSMCIYKMAGSNDCELAALVNGRPYMVEGSRIDDHGDAHAPDGLCNTSRRAIATGKVENDRLKVTKLVALEKP